MKDMTETRLRSYFDAAHDILETARSIPFGHFRTGFKVHSKADESPVTVADREAEMFIRAEIALRFPDHGILGEEYGRERMEADHVWVIDPIDGTKSFVTGNPMWGMLLGLLYRGEPLLGAVAMPALGEIAIGGPGLGCWLNGRPIAARKGVAVKDAFLSLNEVPRMLASDKAVCDRLLGTGRYARATADCYSYVQLAAGWVDGVVDYGLEPYDYLPVLPLVEAAGAVMTDWNGDRLDLKSDGRVVAGTPEIHAHLLEVIAGRSTH